ncbi:hypothetical protein NKG99_04005 [Mesorhizobium sp. M1409]|uniref:hypothetical protein n=1 Tax=Mesorhizobium sp. M1409 TaxID=2957100 RepID=UPI00333D82EF
MRSRSLDQIASTKLAAAAKRVRRFAKLPLSAFRTIVPTNHPGAVLARGEARRFDRKERSIAFDHESAAGAKHRHRAARKGRPRTPKKAPKTRPYNPIDHVHPRHMRQFAERS